MEKITYQISSRAAILLGRESVSKVDGAIIELIKNTYDADASFCILFFDVEHDAIYIIDNGTGMTRDTIQNCWMLIGTDNKKVEYQSKKNRIKSGEKGIGRFALDRLGQVCEMYTKHDSSSKTLYWKTDWKNFEEPGKTISEVAADLDYLNNALSELLPAEIVRNLDEINEDLINNFKTGTILKITNLRDDWTNKAIDKIINMLSYSIPNSGINEYSIYVLPSLTDKIINIENEMLDEFDYKLKAHFDGEKFYVKMVRNEFDLKRIPDNIFELKEFSNYPYTKDDFEKGDFDIEYSIEKLMNSSSQNLVSIIKEIGAFNFDYCFLKMNIASKKDKETFYYKDISPKRRQWLSNNAGVKIYRDNFIVRPYGDINSDSFDWLNLDARKASSPAGLAHNNGSWKVRNQQGYGNVYISRINNSTILDKSSREGIIDNEYFVVFKEVLANIISIFEKDRQYIARGFAKYQDIIDKKEKKKKEGLKLARNILNKGIEQSTEDVSQDDISNTYSNNPESENNSTNNDEQLAEALLLFKEEKDSLLTEIKLLRTLATNGLITTSIVHDLMGLNADLKNRANDFKYVIQNNHADLIDEYLCNLERNDAFLSSWISVVVTQLKQDKRKRVFANIYSIIKNLEMILHPLLKQKNITLNITGEVNLNYKKVFVVDIESIICNLVINSIEAFKKTEIPNRIINIEVTHDESNIIILYTDNGPGVSKEFQTPYEIFNFGVTDKKDNNTGEIIGTGLGMYIVSSTMNEYRGEYQLLDNEGFGLELKFPKEGVSNGNS